MSESQNKPPEDVSEAVPEALQPETYRTSDTRDHLVELDALRGIAIIGVVVQHLTQSWSAFVGEMPIPYLGLDALDLFKIQGVSLFFILSGYLLTWTEGKRARRGAYSLRSYAMRRVLRLVPAYYVALVAVVLLLPQRVSLADFLVHLTFLHGFFPEFSRSMTGVFWSLTPEVVFYCMVPLLVLTLTRLWQRLVLFVVLLLAAVPTHLYDASSVGLEPGRYDNFIAAFPTNHLYLFLVGVLLRMLVEYLGSRPYSPWQPRIAFGLFLISAPYMVLGPPRLVFLRHMGADQVVQSFTRNTVADLLLVSFFAAAILGAPVLRSLLAWRLLSFVGMISYSLFLFHRIIVLMVAKDIVKPWSEWITSSELTLWATYSAYVSFIFVIGCGIAYLGYRFIESPFLRIKPK